MGTGVFEGNNDIVIKLEHKSQPIRFTTFWNKENKQVIWGYKK